MFVYTYHENRIKTDGAPKFRFFYELSAVFRLIERYTRNVPRVRFGGFLIIAAIRNIRLERDGDRVFDVSHV